MVPSSPIHEDGPALVREDGPVGKDQVERGRLIARHIAAPESWNPLHQAQIVRFGDREIRVDRIDSGDRGQQGGLALAHKVARVDAELADDAVDR